MDNDTTCYFCYVGPESIFHVFGSCEKLRVLWKIVNGTIENVTGLPVDFGILRINLIVDLVNVRLGTNRKYDKMLIYFNSIINYTLWKIRNEIKFEFGNFSTEIVVSKIIRSMRARKNIEPKLIESKRIPFIKEEMRWIDILVT